MITWVTVWVLTVVYADAGVHTSKATTYQLTYATQEACVKQIKKHNSSFRSSRCDFQQIPVVINK